MKILAVCGLGQGTSLILRMNVETVLRDMGVDADVEHIDVSICSLDECGYYRYKPRVSRNTWNRYKRQSSHRQQLF